jgi:serine/threonine protein kinase
VLTNTKNENIISLFAVKKTAREVFIVIEYCNYKDLGHYLSEKGVLSEVEIEYFFKQAGKLLVSSTRWKQI